MSAALSDGPPACVPRVAGCLTLFSSPERTYNVAGVFFFFWRGGILIYLNLIRAPGSLLQMDETAQEFRHRCLGDLLTLGHRFIPLCVCVCTLKYVNGRVKAAASFNHMYFYAWI